MPFTLSIIIPCYQNEQNIPALISEMQKLVPALPADCRTEFVLIDDGSADGTLEGLKHFKNEIPNTKIIKLTGNFGSYNAFLAGLNYGTGDCYVQLHADMQDPPSHIPEMVRLWQGGIKMVIGHRVQREDGLISRGLSSFYHRLIRRIALPHIPGGGYDLILFDRILRDQVVAMNESNINLVYLISWLRYPYVTIPVIRTARKKGKSAWTFSKKIKLFIDSVVGFSYFPIRLVSIIAVLFGLGFLAVTAWVIAGFILDWSHSPLFWLFYFMLFCASAVLFCSAVIAEYLWRTLEAARRRPPFVVDSVSE